MLVEIPGEDLIALINMASTYNEDLESGLKEGIYEEGDPVANANAIDRVQQALNAALGAPDPLPEEALADFMRQRIENGDLSLDDIPVRLARYGLMAPNAFVDEMRERMELAKD